MLYKKYVLKNFSKFTDKLKKQSSGSALSKDVLRKFAKFTEKYFCGNLFFNKVAGCRNSHQRQSARKGVLRNFAKFAGEHLCRVSVLIKLQARSTTATSLK